MVWARPGPLLAPSWLGRPRLRGSPCEPPAPAEGGVPAGPSGAGASGATRGEMESGTIAALPAGAVVIALAWRVIWLLSMAWMRVSKRRRPALAAVIAIGVVVLGVFVGAPWILGAIANVAV